MAREVLGGKGLGSLLCAGPSTASGCFALVLGVSGLRNKREKEKADIFNVRIHLKLCPK